MLGKEIKNFNVFRFDTIRFHLMGSHKTSIQEETWKLFLATIEYQFVDGRLIKFNHKSYLCFLISYVLSYPRGIAFLIDLWPHLELHLFIYSSLEHLIE